MLAIALSAGIAVSHRNSFALVPLIPVTVILLLFSSLTVRVDDEAVALRFGPGLIRRRIALGDIVSAVQVRNSWVWGWGIRLIPGGWLYNVSGTQAVELVLTNQRIVRIGTDDPEGLLAAIENAVGGSALADVPPPRLGLIWIGITMIGIACAIIAVLLTLLRTGAL